MTRAVLVGCLVLFSCSNWGGNSSSSPPISSQPPRPDQEIYGAQVTYTKDGMLRLKVRSPVIYRYEDAHKVLMVGGIEAHFYDLEGRHQAQLSAGEGELWELTDRVVVRNRVVIISDSGTLLRTEEIRFDPELNLILADGSVTIITPNDSLTGVGFSSSPDLRSWELKQLSGETRRNASSDRKEF